MSQEKGQKGVLIDYKDLYNSMKDEPATDWRKFELFSVLYLWKENDKRESD